MQEELEKLQKIGAQKIHEQTHIPLMELQAILHSSYDGFSRIQFLGFLSILEREYQLELPEMRAAAVEYFESQEEDQGVFIVPEKKKKRTYLFFAALVIFALAVAYQLFTQESKSEVKIEDSTEIAKVKTKALEVATKVDENVTKQSPTVPQVEVKESVAQKTEPKEEKKVLKPLKITSKSKVWFGYIDVKTNKKYQKTFKGTQELDPNKEWLLMFGHGYINIYVNGKIQKFSSRETVRFLYKDATLQAISAREFKRLNRGQTW